MDPENDVGAEKAQKKCRSARLLRRLPMALSSFCFPGSGQFWLGDSKMGAAFLFSFVVLSFSGDAFIRIGGFVGVYLFLLFYILLAAFASAGVLWARHDGSIQPRRKFGVFVASVIICIFSTLGARSFSSFQLIRVSPTESMVPSLLKREVFLIEKSKGIESINRGKIIVHSEFVSKKGEYFVKRIIGLSGEQIKVQGKAVFINSKQIPQKELQFSPMPRRYGNAYAESAPGAMLYLIYFRRFHKRDEAPMEWQLGEDEVFVMGDNRDVSLDSRKKGPVKLSQIVGTARFIVFSGSLMSPRWNRIGQRL